MSEDKFVDAVRRLVPSSLDDIVRENRDVASIRLATDEDLLQLRSPVAPDAAAVPISRWTLFTLEIREEEAPGFVATMLTGWRDDLSHSWVTSRLLKLDEETHCVRTASGHVYHMVGTASREPDLLAICGWLHKTRLGEFLGVLPIFY